MTEQSKGILFVSAAALLNVFNVEISQIMDKQRLPYYRMTGCGCLLSGIVILTSWGFSGGQASRRQILWALAYGLGGASMFVLQLLSASFGTPLGDIGALFSLNVSIAACQCRILLKEPVNLWHGVGLILAMVGATLISRPSFFFGSDDAETKNTDEKAWLGYVLAIASAVCMAQCYFSARKSQGTSMRVLTASILCQRGVALVLVQICGVVDDHSLENLSKSPLASSGYFIAVMTSILLTMYSSTAGFKACPAALSAVVYAAVNMTAGYTADEMVSQKPPEVLTLVGACLLCSAAAFTTKGKLVEERKAELTVTGNEIDVEKQAKETGRNRQ